MRLRAILIQVVAATALGVSVLAQGAKPPVPSGLDPGGVAIALIGAGIEANRSPGTWRTRTASPSTRAKAARVPSGAATALS
jgi:hypothetical protein